MARNQTKFALIGAGSGFCPPTLKDIFLNDRFNSIPLSIALMDRSEKALAGAEQFARAAAKIAGRGNVEIVATTRLEKALEGADFVVSAIESGRFYYWSMDFHIPRRYGFRQVFGENGGPGGMFHFLRNLPPLLEVAHTMEKVCPNAWLLNYSNPEAKLIEGVLKLSKARAVGLCHGDMMGVDQISKILGIPADEIDTELIGLNHFGVFTKITRRATGEDLYPLLRERERSIDLLAHWDDLALSRIMLRTYGLYPYPGTNHIGEYVAWAEDLMASQRLQYFYDPASNDPWNGGTTPEFVYSLQSDPTRRPLQPMGDKEDSHGRFEIPEGRLEPSHEYGIPVAEAIAFDLKKSVGAVNVQNTGFASNLPLGMVVETGAVLDAQGIHPKPVDPLPTAYAAMLSTQGAIPYALT